VSLRVLFAFVFVVVRLFLASLSLQETKAVTEDAAVNPAYVKKVREQLCLLSCLVLGLSSSLPCLVLFCVVLQCLVVSCRVLSSLILFCFVLSCLVFVLSLSLCL
jgi:hypothetical protein